MAAHVDPLLRQFVLHDLHRLNRALESRRVDHIEHEARLEQQHARAPGLFPSLGGQVDVGPTREAVLQIPGALAMAQQNQLVHDALT